MADNIEIDWEPEAYGGHGGDSAYSSGLDSDTVSLATTAPDHVYQFGRRFHGYKQGIRSYILPDDEKEQERMDLQHHYLTLALGGQLYTAPIKDKNPQRIVDLGTGTGIWALEISDEFPSAEVWGIDLSPIQPQWVPPNLKFEVDDVEDDWTWPENHFDYIHMRMLAGMLDNWPKLVRQIYHSLRPGGYVELQDLTDFYSCDDDSVPPDASTKRLISVIAEAERALGRPWLEVGQVFHSLLQEHRFVDINETVTKVPLGPWAKDKTLKEIGLYARHEQCCNADSFIMAAATRVLGWDIKDVNELAERFKEDAMNPKQHPYVRYYCIYARKPEE